MLGRGRRSAGSGRRSGPVDEEPWWDPQDQAAAERPILDRRDLGRGWLPMPMLNNAERLDPLGDDDASAAITVARRARRLVALDEGQAWRRHKSTTLVVARVEAFADEDEATHRQVWAEHAEASLDATWRQRWRERERDPGWIEAGWVAIDDRPGALHGFGADADPPEPARSVDWLRIEDHTDPGRQGAVTVYEHLTLWAGTRHATLTIRHDLDDDVDETAVSAAVAALERLRRP